MKKMRTLVVMHESLVPPENLEGHTEKEIEEWRTEYDVTTTLRKGGHDVRCMGVMDSLTELRSAIADWKPDVVFNLLEEIVVREHGEETWDLLLERAGLGGVYTSLGNYPDGTSRRSLPWLARCSRCQPTVE